MFFRREIGSIKTLDARAVTMDARELRDLVPVVEKLLRDVGAYLLGAQGNVKTEWKGEDDPVTEADRTAERMLRIGLLAILPAEFRGEESPWSMWSPNDLCWLVDPLDGTKAFIAREKGWSISVALLRGDTLLLGAVHVPLTKETYWAVRGGGAWRNDVRLNVSAVADGPSILVSPRLGPLPVGHTFVTYVGAAYKCCLVAEGRADAYYHYKKGRGVPHPWDLAAGALLVEEAGGRVSHLDGRPLCYNLKDPLYESFLLSNAHVHESLLAKLPPRKFKGK